MAETAEQAAARIQAAHRAKQNPATFVTPVDGKAGEILQGLWSDEPVFIFRAQDILSVFALDAYAQMVEKYDPHGPQIESIVHAAEEFRQWQRANPEKVKLPD